MAKTTAETMTGTVKWFEVRKGFGFITDEEGVDWNVHFSSINMDGFKKLRPGQTVSFTTEDDDHGRSAAKDVTILEEAV